MYVSSSNASLFMSTNVLYTDPLVKPQSAQTAIYNKHMRAYNKPDENLVAKNLRYLMDTRQMTERALAAKSNVAQKTINKILNKKSSPTLRTMHLLASATRTSVADLVSIDLSESKQSLPSAATTYTKSIDESVLAVALSYVGVEWGPLSYDQDELQLVAGFIAEAYIRLQWGEQDSNTIKSVMATAIKNARQRYDRQHQGDHESSSREEDHG